MTDSASTSSKVIQLLNDASLAKSDAQKLRNLLQVQELVVNKEPALLDSFTDEVLVFQRDRSAEIRKFVIGFMEEASKKDNELLTKVTANLNLILVDENVGVLKKLIQSMTQLFGIILNWLSSAQVVSDSHKACWKVTCGLKDHILTFMDSNNDGIRTQCVKFAEKVVMVLSEPQPGENRPAKLATAFTVNDVPPQHEILKTEDLKADGEKALTALLAFVSNPAISSVNLMAAMGSLSGIARLRPQFMGTVVQAFETLHANLPPTLAKTQVTSVRKHLKMQLMNMLRLISSLRYHPQITNLLYDLGTTSSEIAKNMPKLMQQQSRKEDGSKGESSSLKKVKKEPEDSDDDDNIQAPSTSIDTPSVAQPVVNQQSLATDITAKELLPLLSPENVANLVLLSMVMLPDKMPDAFQASYTPIESAGTEDQIKHLARLLSIQMTAMKIGPGVQKAAEMAAREKDKKREKKLEESGAKEKKLKIQTVIGGHTKPVVNEDLLKDRKAKENIEAMISSQTVTSRHGIHRRIQGFKLESITTPLSLEVKDKIVKQAVERVLKAEANLSHGAVYSQWQKILPSLVAQFGGDLHRTLAEFILGDIRNRSSLAFCWLYEEFNIYLENSRGSNDKAALENYDACLTGILQGFREKPEVRDNLFCRLVMQAPLLTDGSMQQITQYCDSEKRANAAVKLLTRLVHLRPVRKMQFLRILLDLTTSAKEIIQSEAIESIKVLYKEPDLEGFIHAYSVTHIKYLTSGSPPNSILNQLRETGDKNSNWTEPTIKLCLSLFLAILPLNHSLIMELAGVYVAASGDIKRVILRVLDDPVGKMGMNSPDLLRLVDGCPKGAETLVTRVLHILTDKSQPSEELVQRVRDLYIKRVPDVRFLIPVLNGLEKNEVLKALPKLVQLSPVVVKGVFNRLLGVNRNRESEPITNALTPVELLVALHDIDSNVADVKSIIKATSYCFQQKAVYTSEVLVMVINQLVDREPIPTLLMRTVIQSVITYPRLSGFIMNVLQRLIMKRIWEQKKVWEGFIKCCQRLKPQSFQVLLQLPSTQLLSVFESIPELRNAMKQYVDRCTPQQRLHINKDIIAILETTPSQKEQNKVKGVTPSGQIVEPTGQIILKQEIAAPIYQGRPELALATTPPTDGLHLIKQEPTAGYTASGPTVTVTDASMESPDEAEPPAPGTTLTKSPQVKLVMTRVPSQGQKRRSPTPTLDEEPEPKAQRIDDS